MPGLRPYPFEAGMKAKPDEFEGQPVDEIVARAQSVNEDIRADLRLTGRYSKQRGKVLFNLYGEITDCLATDKAFVEEAQERVLQLYKSVRAEGAGIDAVVDAEFTPQAPVLAINNAAGDSGTPIAMALYGAPLEMCWGRYTAVELRNIFWQILKNGGKVPKPYSEIANVKWLEGLRGDGKINVTPLYDGAELVGISKVTIALEHDEKLQVEELRSKAAKVAEAFFWQLGEKYSRSLGKPKIIVNGRGAWNTGGHIVDAGSSEAKPQRHAFGPYGLNEDSMAGEDPTKVSSTGLFGAREIAVLAVRQLEIKRAIVTTDYTIGHDEVEVTITAEGGRNYSPGELREWVKSLGISLAIPDLIKRYDLKNPKWRHEFAVNSDYFHNAHYPWNSAAGLKDYEGDWQN